MSNFYSRMKAERIAAKERERTLGKAPTYKILQVDQLNRVDRERASAVGSYVASGEEARRMAGQEGFKYMDIDLQGRCGELHYKNVAIRLLYKREIVEREPSPAEPVPQCVLHDPKDAWISIDLLNVDSATKQKGIGDRLSQAFKQIENLRTLWVSEETSRKNLEAEAEKWKKEKLELKAARERITLLEEQLKSGARQLEYEKAQLQKEKRERTEDRVRIVGEIFPMFNTMWMAGQHRVGDQLYGMLRKQATEALGKIGLELVEPKLGDEFDPQLHHAVHSHHLDPTDKRIGAITQVNKVGWKLQGGRVVEAAEVAVGVERTDSDTTQASV
jgi:molecular chaperone GrpE (heat shock protein)